MRILHTADWHIGQTLNGWTREAEHTQWLDTLSDVIVEQEIDVMIVAGDVYDGINPSGDSQRILYRALRRCKERRPNITIIKTSGNHDPAGRLEAPSPILESLDVHVVATVRRNGDEIDVAQHMIPLPGRDGEAVAWVCAIPFLRAADLPGLSFAANEGRGSPIVEAARRFHLAIARGAREIAGDLPIIAMGHLHCHGASESSSEAGSAERRILIGGEHALPEDVFPEAFDYVALGHLHRPQTLGGGRIRYSGSCFPLSAAEMTYEHGVTIIDLDEDGLRHTHHTIARPAQVLRLPEPGAGPMSLELFEEKLGELDLDPDLPKNLQPFIYVSLEATGPALVLLAEAEKLLDTMPLRTAGLRVRRVSTEEERPAPVSLQDTTPEELFRQAFIKANVTDPEEHHIAAFREALVGA
jgi:exonuclease SbcD